MCSLPLVARSCLPDATLSLLLIAWASRGCRTPPGTPGGLAAGQGSPGSRRSSSGSALLPDGDGGVAGRGFGVFTTKGGTSEGSLLGWPRRAVGDPVLKVGAVGTAPSPPAGQEEAQTGSALLGNGVRPHAGEEPRRPVPVLALAFGMWQAPVRPPGCRGALPVKQTGLAHHPCVNLSAPACSSV